MSVEWILYPRIRTFVEIRFHCLFSKKKGLKSGGFVSEGFVIEIKLRASLLLHLHLCAFLMYLAC